MKIKNLLSNLTGRIDALETKKKFTSEKPGMETLHEVFSNEQAETKSTLEIVRILLGESKILENAALWEKFIDYFLEDLHLFQLSPENGKKIIVCVLKQVAQRIAEEFSQEHLKALEIDREPTVVEGKPFVEVEGLLEIDITPVPLTNIFGARQKPHVDSPKSFLDKYK